MTHAASLEQQPVQKQTAWPEGCAHDVVYTKFLTDLQTRFTSNVVKSDTEYPDVAIHRPIFQSTAKGLWNAYLDGFPAESRQQHNCMCCHDFIKKFGGLVTLTPDGKMEPAFWNPEDTPDEYKASIAAMTKIVQGAEVKTVFYSEDETLGNPRTGIWTHLALTNPQQFSHPIDTAFQAAAKKKEDNKNILVALAEFNQDVLDVAVRILDSDAFYRNEKVLGPGKWLCDLQRARGAVQNSREKKNVVWHAVALAPDGFLHPRASMIGTLLEDIQQGRSFEDVAKRFSAKMKPTVYQRPTAPPSAGNIEQAEKIIAAFGGEKAMARRFARLNEIIAIWTPPQAMVKDEPKTSVFGHLKPKAEQTVKLSDVEIPATPMTADKFIRTVLPEAVKIEGLLPYSSAYIATMLTNLYDDAEPIIQWDRAERRNPVTMYVERDGSNPRRFGLAPGWAEVVSICNHPANWYEKKENMANMLIFMLKGAKETMMRGSAIFPENLRSELHSIRSTVEAYSNNAQLPEHDGDTASGLVFQAGSKAVQTVRVTRVDGSKAIYKIDRWD